MPSKTLGIPLSTISASRWVGEYVFVAAGPAAAAFAAARSAAATRSAVAFAWLSPELEAS